MELAVCLPVLLAITFGSVELANSIYLRQVLLSASYEAGNVITAVGGTENEAYYRCHQILTARGVKEAVLTFNPPVTSKTPTGTTVEVTITAPVHSNSVVPKFYRDSTTVKVCIKMVRL